MINRCLNKPVVATSGTVFTLIGANAFGVALFIENTGDTNDVNYDIQESTENVDGSFSTISDDANANGTLGPGDVVLIRTMSSLPYIRMIADSAGGSDVKIGITQWEKNISDVLPILNI